MKHNSSQSGFSLVETLVSITILLIVIIGPMTIMSTASNSASFASDQVIAFFLAQEGAELAQKARDDIVLNRFLDPSDGSYDANPWGTFTNETSGGPYYECFLSSGCGLEITESGDGAIDTPQNCGTASACDLYYDDATANTRSRYTHDSTGNSETPFRRTVTFETISASEIRVVSEVEWFSGRTRNAQSIQVETFLIDVYGP